MLVNQKTNGNQVEPAGNYLLLGHVTIRTDGTTGYVMADAVRFVLRHPTDTYRSECRPGGSGPGGSDLGLCAATAASTWT